MKKTEEPTAAAAPTAATSAPKPPKLGDRWGVYQLHWDALEAAGVDPRAMPQAEFDKGLPTTDEALAAEFQKLHAPR